MSATLSFATAIDRLGLRSLVAFAANMALRGRGGGGQRFSVDDRGRWVNAQPHATIVSPTIHTVPLADMRDTVLDNWCWQYLPKAGDVVIDVGAGVGEEAVVFSGFVGPTGRVVSIEAHPETFECLRNTIERSSLTNVTALPYAVTDQLGEVRIHDQRNHLANSIISAGKDGGEIVVSTTLDAVAEELKLGPVALLKMNIEGAERSAVRGMETLSRNLRYVVISCHDFIADRGAGGEEFRTFDDVRARLESLGFETICRADHALPWVRGYIYGRNRSEV